MYFDKFARKEIIKHTIANYNRIEVTAGKLRYNHQCHMNSVHEAKKHKHKKLAMCIYFDGDYPIIHFINYDGKKFICNTLGEWINCYDFYFVRWIKDKDMWNINDIFTNYRRELRKTLSWWVRLISKYDA